MINIFLLGLDQFAVGEYSRDHTPDLANLFEAHSEDIDFLAPSLFVFHEGAEQTSWNALAIVRAPKKYALMEKAVAEYLMKTLTVYAVHVAVEFEYFDEGNRYENHNHDYPRFMKGEHVDPGEYDGSMYHVGEDPEHDHEEECDCHHHHDDEADPRDRADLDPNDPNQIYLGNAFEDFEEKMKQRAEALDVKDDKKGGE